MIMATIINYYYYSGK